MYLYLIDLVYMQLVYSIDPKHLSNYLLATKTH